MKTALFLAVSLCAAPIIAQVSTPSNPNPPGANSPDIGPDYRTLTPNQNSMANSVTFGSKPDVPKRGKVIEIATGLNYWDGTAWNPSVPAFEQNQLDGSFIASRVQHVVTLSPDINVAGAISVKVGNQVLSSSPIGIGLYDALSGQFLLIGSITNCAGVLLSSNQVYYGQPYSGICASLLYTIEQGAVSQDVVFTGRLNPADYGFPNDTTRIQIITEFYQPPTPDILREPVSIQSDPTLRNQMASPDLFDETLTFGPLVFGAGQAFTLPGSLDPTAEAGLVAKEFVQNSDGRYFLIESIPFTSIQRGLLGLPVCSSAPQQAIHQKVDLKKGYARIPSAPDRGLRATKPHSKLGTFARTKPNGVYIDYRATLSTGATLAQSDTTYLVSGTLSCSTLTIEGGCVLKYKVGASIIVNTLVCKTSQFRPAILTAVDDDTVGESMNGYTNSGYTNSISSGGYANPALKLGTQTLTVSGCNFRYAQKAIQYGASSIPSTTINVTHSQLYKCLTGIDLLWSGSGSGAGGSGTVAINLNNALLANVQNAININSLNTTVLPTFINCTLDQMSSLITGSGGSMTFDSTNSIYSQITNSSSGFGAFYGQDNAFYSSTTFGSSWLTTNGLPFQSVGAGNYYLTDASQFRNAGTTSGVPSSLISDLGKRTTYPPILIAATTLTTPQTFSPQAGRDADTLDLGYHYDPLDFELGGVLVTNAAITFNPGTIIGTFGTNSISYGLAVGQAASLSSQGTPTMPIWIVEFNTVQDQPYTNWFQTNAISSEFQGLSPGSTNNFRFTSWSMLSQAAPLFNAPTNIGPFSFKDCEFNGGKQMTFGPTLNLSNCLLERVHTDLEPRDGKTNYISTCLAYGGDFTLASSNAVVSDNLFDKPAITNWNSYTGTLNAYITNNSRLAPSLGNDILLSASPTYQAGPLGNYYQQSSSVLINADTSTTANQVGLYHYTVMTNILAGAEIKETNSLVDVSYHYVAVDTNGIPIDSNSDGIPDYLSDLNGNGAVDSGEVGWNIIGDLGLKVIITRPKNNLTIP